MVVHQSDKPEDKVLQSDNDDHLFLVNPSSSDIGNTNINTSDFSFKRSARLLTPKDYKHTFDAVHIKLHQPNLMCLVSIHSKNKNLDTNTTLSSRLGLAISKAKNKRAPERNRIKRLIREHFRLHHHELPETVDMVFLAKTRTDDVSNADIHRQLDTMWQKLIKRLS